MFEFGGFFEDQRSADLLRGAVAKSDEGNAVLFAWGLNVLRSSLPPAPRLDTPLPIGSFGYCENPSMRTGLSSASESLIAGSAPQVTLPMTQKIESEGNLGGVSEPS